jgi:PLP dependent protein
MSHTVVHNLRSIQSEIESIFAHYFLVSRPIKIIVVSKTQTADAIIPLLDAGHRIFGENKVSEAFEKWTPLKAQYPDIELHLIGGLQTNKIKKALQIFDVIQTVDCIHLIDEIVKHKDIVHNKKFFIQINTGEETQKSGISPDGFSDLLSYATNKHMKISGIMCIPPVLDNPTYHFSVMQSLSRQHGSLDISAGMSSDYHKAIIHGTDYIRIGTAIFGQRDLLFATINKIP